jgi:hypothetical protein
MHTEGRCTHNDAMRPAVVAAGDGAEPLLASCVPLRMCVCVCVCVCVCACVCMRVRKLSHEAIGQLFPTLGMCACLCQTSRKENHNDKLIAAMENILPMLSMQEAQAAQLVIRAYPGSCTCVLAWLRETCSGIPKRSSIARKHTDMHVGRV